MQSPVRNCRGFGSLHLGMPKHKTACAAPDLLYSHLQHGACTHPVDLMHTPVPCQLMLPEHKAELVLRMTMTTLPFIANRKRR